MLQANKKSTKLIGQKFIYAHNEWEQVQAHKVGLTKVQITQRELVQTHAVGLTKLIANSFPQCVLLFTEIIRIFAQRINKTNKLIAI